MLLNFRLALPNLGYILPVSFCELREVTGSFGICDRITNEQVRFLFLFQIFGALHYLKCYEKTSISVALILA